MAPRRRQPRARRDGRRRARGRRREALARSAYVAAGSAFETAAELSPDDASGCGRTLVAAARCGWRRVRARGGAAARACSSSPPTRRSAPTCSSCAAPRLLFTRPRRRPTRLLVAEAERVQPHDRARAAAMFATASLPASWHGELERARGIRRPRRAAAERESDMATLLAPAMLRVVAATPRRAGRSASGRSPTARARAGRAAARRALHDHGGALAWTSRWIEEWTLAQEADRAHDHRRAHGRRALGAAAPAGDARRTRVPPRPPGSRLRRRDRIGPTRGRHRADHRFSVLPGHARPSGGRARS